MFGRFNVTLIALEDFVEDTQPRSVLRLALLIQVVLKNLFRRLIRNEVRRVAQFSVQPTRSRLAVHRFASLVCRCPTA